MGPLDRTGSVQAGAPARAGRLGSDDPEAVYVSTGTFGIVTPNTGSSVLQTSGIGPCVAVALHDANGVAALSHFHPSQDPRRSLEVMLRAARAAGLDPATTRAHVIGGRDDAAWFANSVLDAVKDTGLPVVEQDLFGSNNRAVQVHARTRVVERYIEVGNDRPVTPNDGPVAVMQRHPRAWQLPRGSR